MADILDRRFNNIPDKFERSYKDATDDCLIEKLAKNHYKRTGKHMTTFMAVCNCKKCIKISM